MLTSTLTVVNMRVIEQILHISPKSLIQINTDKERIIKKIFTGNNLTN